MLGGAGLPSQADAFTGNLVGGADLAGWKSVIGDGVWGRTRGQGEVSIADIRAKHSGAYSTLQANTRRRLVMAHNITYTSANDLDTIGNYQEASVEFRLPDMPARGNQRFNAQTLEAGLFVWDGADTRLDYGMAFQWLLNPWLPSFGALRVWRQTNTGPRWTDVGYLQPDTEWHRLDIRYQATGSTAALLVDGNLLDAQETLTTKPDYWGDTIAGRFQVEIISMWPGKSKTGCRHEADFRNWSWLTP